MKHTIIVIISLFCLLSCGASEQRATLTTCDAPAEPPHFTGVASICGLEGEFYWDGGACVAGGPLGCLQDPLRPQIETYQSREECEVAHAHCI